MDENKILLQKIELMNKNYFKNKDGIKHATVWRKQ